VLKAFEWKEPWFLAMFQVGCGLYRRCAVGVEILVLLPVSARALRLVHKARDNSIRYARFSPCSWLYAAIRACCPLR
jgi:hypothetical protein